MRCDKAGCRGIPYAEVYPMDGTWSFLCKKHFDEDFAKYGNKYGWCILSLFERIKFLLVIWK